MNECQVKTNVNQHLVIFAHPCFSTASKIILTQTLRYPFVRASVHETIYNKIPFYILERYFYFQL